MRAATSCTACRQAGRQRQAGGRASEHVAQPSAGCWESSRASLCLLQEGPHLFGHVRSADDVDLQQAAGGGSASSGGAVGVGAGVLVGAAGWLAGVQAGAVQGFMRPSTTHRGTAWVAEKGKAALFLSGIAIHSRLLNPKLARVCGLSADGQRDCGALPLQHTTADAVLPAHTANAPSAAAAPPLVPPH